MHECKQEKVIDLIINKLDSIDEKLDTLLAYKWAIMGGAAVVAFIISFIGLIIKGV